MADFIDKKYLAEVQRINGRAFLCVFDLAGRCRHAEETNLVYGATHEDHSQMAAALQKVPSVDAA